MFTFMYYKYGKPIDGDLRLFAFIANAILDLFLAAIIFGH